MIRQGVNDSRHHGFADIHTKFAIFKNNALIITANHRYTQIRGATDSDFSDLFTKKTDCIDNFKR